MSATLSLKAPTAPQAQKAAPAPTFNPRAHYGEVAGIPGVKYVQGDALFDSQRRFVRFDEEHALARLTPEQEQDRQMRALAQRKLQIGAQRNEGGSIPDHVARAQRENQQAAAVELAAE